MRVKSAAILGGILVAHLSGAAHSEPVQPHCHSYVFTAPGVVIGLHGTGDDPQRVPFTSQALEKTLPQLGIEGYHVPASSRSFAAVLVTALIRSCTPGAPFALAPGQRIDLMVADMGTAASIDGGLLLPTKLVGPDGVVHVEGAGILADCPPEVPPQRTSLGAALRCVVGGGRFVGAPSLDQRSDAYVP